MSQQGNFFGGFILGTIVGGIVGGVIGVVTAHRLTQSEATNEESLPLKEKSAEPKAVKPRSLKQPTEQSMEIARRGLEDKIAQLNDAIDDVRQQLGTVNGKAKAEVEKKRGAIAPDNS